MENLPLYISVVFALTTFLTIGLFYKAANNSRMALTILLIWIALQGFIAASGFYTASQAMAPRFMSMVMPPMLCIVVLFSTVRGRAFVDSLDPKTLTILHIVRIPVEVVLFWLFVHQLVPEIMTFEGRNLDILSGLSAPVIFYFGFIRKKLNRKIILIWNFLCVGLLVNIVAIAALSAPFPFQKFGLDQPNVAVLNFPFNWLPSTVVPLVLLSHLATIRHLIRIGKMEKQNLIQG